MISLVSTTPPLNNFYLLFVGDVLGRLGGYLWTIVGEVVGTCLGFVFFWGGGRGV